MKIQTEFLGLDDLESALLDLAKEFGPRNAVTALNLPLKRAIQPVYDDVESGTLTNTKRRKRLKEKLKLKVSKPPKQTIGPHLDKRVPVVASVGYFWKRGEKGGYYATALRHEFGDKKTPAQGVLRKSLRRHRETMIKTFSDELGKAVDKRAKLLGAQRTRKGRKFVKR